MIIHYDSARVTSAASGTGFGLPVGVRAPRLMQGRLRGVSPRPGWAAGTATGAGCGWRTGWPGAQVAAASSGRGCRPGGLSARRPACRLRGGVPGSRARILTRRFLPYGVGCVSCKVPGWSGRLFPHSAPGGRRRDVIGKGAGGGRWQGPAAAFPAGCSPWSAGRHTGCLRLSPAGDTALSRAAG